jgi:uncharacterized protein YbjQ (UPF0145 family)
LQSLSEGGCGIFNAIMITTTTPSIDGKSIQQYLGIVSGESVIGANIFRDLFASVRDIVGGAFGIL